MTRNQLIQLCKDAIIPHQKWKTSNSYAQQVEISMLHQALTAGAWYNSKTRKGLIRLKVYINYDKYLTGQPLAISSLEEWRRDCPEVISTLGEIALPKDIYTCMGYSYFIVSIPTRYYLNLLAGEDSTSIDLFDLIRANENDLVKLGHKHPKKITKLTTILTPVFPPESEFYDIEEGKVVAVGYDGNGIQYDIEYVQNDGSIYTDTICEFELGCLLNIDRYSNQYRDTYFADVTVEQATTLLSELILDDLENMQIELNLLKTCIAHAKPVVK